MHTDVSDDDGTYWQRTAFPTGGIWRVPLQHGRFAGRPSWAVPPSDCELGRPSGIAFSGTTAYVATFVTVPDDLPTQAAEVTGGRGRCDPRGVIAYDLPPPGRTARAWSRRLGWDALACARAGIFPWALAVDGGTGALLATAHGGAAGHVVAQLCPATGAVLAIWRHPAMDDAAPNALALL